MHSSSSTPSRFGLLLLCSVFASGLFMPLAHAEKTDKEQPMVIEADQLRHEEKTGRSVFIGNVSIRKGSMEIRAERVDVTENDQGDQTGVAEGTALNRATFKQKRQGLEEFVYGTAERIEYVSGNERLILIGNAELRRLRGNVVADEAQGQRIEYSSATGAFQVAGQIQAGDPKGRVRAVIAPKEIKPNSAAGKTGTP